MGSLKFENIVCTTMNPTELKTKLCQLEKLLLKWMPHSVHLLVICRLGILGKFLEDNLIQFYKLVEEGEDPDLWHEDEKYPFIVCIQRPNIIAKKGVMLMAPEPATPEMIQAFDSFIGWDTPQIFGSTPEHFSKVILKLVDLNGEPSERDHHCNFYSILDLEKAKNLKVDEEFLKKEKLTIRKLQEHEVKEAFKGWPHVKDHTENELRKHIRKGLYTSGVVNEEGEVITTFMHSTQGLFNGLYTPEEHRRKGLGHILVTWMVRNVSNELGLYPIVEADVDNIPSRKLLEKVGFKKVQETRWIFYKPKSSTS